MDGRVSRSVPAEGPKIEGGRGTKKRRHFSEKVLLQILPKFDGVVGLTGSDGPAGSAKMLNMDRN